MSGGGAIGSLIVGVATNHMVLHWLNIPQPLQTESLTVFYILCLSIPVVIITTGLRALLEAYQQFAVSNMIRIPLGLLTFLAPLAVLPFSNSLAAIVAVLFLGRLIGVYAYYHYCVRAVPAIRNEITFDKKQVRTLLSFGGWMTVTNVLGPLMVYFDRFLIGFVLTMTAVSYYVAPYEMVTRLWMIPMGLIGVLFPTFSTMLSADRTKAVHLFTKGTNMIFYLMFPVFLVINLFAYEGINFWLGSEFAENSTVVMQWLAIGVFLNCVGRIPFVLIQSAGRPDLPAKLYLFELPFYVAALWYALNIYGIKGAAAVWTIRVFIDTAAFFVMSSKAIRETAKPSLNIGGKILIASTVLFSVTFIDEIILKTALLLSVCVLISVGTIRKWKLFPNKGESFAENIFAVIRSRS
jgi:O-antigen/teichoic acid export membrane protein